MKSIPNDRGAPGEFVLVTSLEDNRKHVARKVNLKRGSDKERRALMMDFTLLRKLHRPNLVGFVEGFVEESEMIVVLDMLEGSTGTQESPHTSLESVSSVEELKAEFEALYSHNREISKQLKHLQSENESLKGKCQSLSLDLNSAINERNELETRGRDLVSLVERKLSGWLGEFTGKAGTWAGNTPLHKAREPLFFSSGRQNGKSRGRMKSMDMSFRKEGVQTAKHTKVSSISLTLDTSTPSIQNVRERLTSLRESKLTIESQLRQLQLDLDAASNTSLSSSEL